MITPFFKDIIWQEKGFFIQNNAHFVKINDNFVSERDRYRSWSGTETVLFESVAGYERFLDIDIRSVSLEHRLFRLNPLTLRLFFSDVEYCALVRYSHNLTSQVLENNFRRTF